MQLDSKIQIIYISLLPEDRKVNWCKNFCITLSKTTPVVYISSFAFRSDRLKKNFQNINFSITIIINQLKKIKNNPQFLEFKIPDILNVSEKKTFITFLKNKLNLGLKLLTILFLNYVLILKKRNVIVVVNGFYDSISMSVIKLFTKNFLIGDCCDFWGIVRKFFAVSAQNGIHLL